MLKIRQAKENDCKSCYELSKVEELKKASGEYIRLIDLKRFARENQMFLVAEYDKKIVGYLFGERTAGDAVLLWLLVVMPEYRSKGIGKKLMVHFQKECKKRKLYEIILYAPKFNKKTLQFYENLGYNRGMEVVEFNKEFY